LISHNNTDWSSAFGTATFIATAVLGVVLFRHVITFLAVTTHKLGELITNGARNLKTAQTKRQRDATFTRYEQMHPSTYAAEVKRRNLYIDRRAEWAKRLEEAAEWVESWRFQFPYLSRRYVELLRRESDKCIADGHAALDELEQCEVLWREICAARATKARDKDIAEVRCLLGLMASSTEAAAKAALNKLNRYRDIDWLNLIPNDLPLPVRAQAAKLCALAAGTNILNESRAALSRLRSLLQTHSVAWERMVA
jgi:hypothetical protein